MAPLGRKPFQERGGAGRRAPGRDGSSPPPREAAADETTAAPEPPVPPTSPGPSPLLVLTDRSQSEVAGRRLIDTVAMAVDAGAGTIVLREKDLSRAKRYLLALSLTDLLVPAGAVMVVASDVKMALDLGAVAVHLAVSDPVPDTTGWPPAMVWGRSCHSVDDVARAAAEGAGYVTLSPVFASSSKPGYGPALGTDALAEAASAALGAGGVDATGPSIYALGGVTPENAAGCLGAGAAGVAVMGGVMAARDPGTAVGAYLAALTTDPRRDLGRRTFEPLPAAGSDSEPGGSADERP